LLNLKRYEKSIFTNILKIIVFLFCSIKISRIFVKEITTKKIEIMTAIIKLREIQNEEVLNGFKNGNLWNDLEDMIYKLENPEVETIQGDMYGAKEKGAK